MAPGSVLENSKPGVLDDSFSDSSLRGSELGRCSRVHSSTDGPINWQPLQIYNEKRFLYHLKFLFFFSPICEKCDKNMFGLTKCKISIVLMHL